MTLTIPVDINVYPEEAVFKAVYWYTGKYDVQITRQDPFLLVAVASEEHEPPEAFAQAFNQSLVDFRLRQIVDTETRTIRELIIAKAFSHFEEETVIFDVADPVSFNPDMS